MPGLAAARFCGGVLLILGLIFSPVFWMIFSIRFTAENFQKTSPGFSVVEVLLREPDWNSLNAGNCGVLGKRSGEWFVHGSPDTVKDLPVHLTSWVEAGCFEQGEVRFSNGFAYNAFVKFQLNPEGRVLSAEIPRYSF